MFGHFANAEHSIPGTAFLARPVVFDQEFAAMGRKQSRSMKLLPESLISPNASEVQYRDPEACPICDTRFDRNGSAFSLAAIIPQRLAHYREFEVWRCRTCTVGITAPQPTPDTTPLLYSAKDTADFDVVQHTLIDWLKDELARRAVRGIVQGRRVRACLDFGAGNGRFAYALTRVLPNTHVVAVDFTEATPDPARSYFGRGLSYLSYRTFEEMNDRFDLILCRHVLEHTHDPRGFIESLRRRLNPGGVLYFEVPNFDSAFAKLTGPYNPGYYVPRHIVHFTRKSLRIAAGDSDSVRFGATTPPMMGNLLADISGHRRNELLFQLVGIPLYPLQLAADALLRTASCLTMEITAQE